MERQSVDSSNLASVGYDDKNQILEIEFNSGSIYQYSNVPQGVYSGLMSAESHGGYFSAHIRNKYDYREI